MQMVNLEELLEPVSADAPCGRNMEYEAPFLALNELARGKPQSVIGEAVRPGQEPDWTQVIDSARGLFSLTKDLRVAGVLHVALVKTYGADGLERGLCVMRGLLEQHWDGVHPLLDADDDNDPTFRVNALVSGIASDEALDAIRRATLLISRQHGAQTLRQFRIASGHLKPEGDSIDREQARAGIEAALAETPRDTLKQIAGRVAGAAEHLNAIRALLEMRAGGVPPELESLSADIADMRKLFTDHMPQQQGRASEPQQRIEAEQTSSVPAVDFIRNRADVVDALERICAYYKNAEPSSPVPLLLRRAQRLVNKDFMDIIRDLTPAAISEAEVISGIERKEN